MRNLLFKMSYAGTNYHGFQYQPNVPTIEGALKDALKILTGEDVTVYGCGRTDAGVHAINYYFNFKTESSIPDEKFPAALNSRLAGDIAVKECRQVDDDFNARFCAKRKTYRYLIDNTRIRNPFNENRALFFPQQLDVEKMREAAGIIEGEKDFAAFMAQGSNITDTVRHIYNISISKNDSLIAIDVCGNGFLYNMVRIITGTLIDASLGKIRTEELERLISLKKRENMGFTAAAHGLYLYEVIYDI